MVALQEVWQSNPHLSEDPTRSFAFAWKHLRDKYKEIQEFARSMEDPSAHLYDKLTQLKLDILEDSSLFQREEFQELRDQIREAKLIEANRV